MKKKIIATAAAAIMAVTSLSAVAYAEDPAVQMMGMDNPFAGCYEKLEDGTWKITDRCLKLVNMALADDEAEFYIHFTFSEKLDSAMINFKFFEGKNEYGYVEDMMKLDGRRDIYLSVSHIVACTIENSGKADLDFSKIEYGIMDLGVYSDKLTDVEITAKDGTEDTEYSMFQSGVWAAYKTDEEGNYSSDDLKCYFVFYDEENGKTLNEKSGLPFVCEQKGRNILFHLGGADDNTEAYFVQTDDGSIYGTLDWGGKEETYRFVQVRLADPETFDQNAPISRGVWGMYFEGEDGELDMFGGYLVMNDAENGFIASEDHVLMSGVKLSQNITNANFTYDVYKTNEDLTVKIMPDGDILLDEDNVPVRLSFDGGTDPDTFNVEEYELSETDWEMPDPANVIMDASATAGGNVGITINYLFPLEKGFDLSFRFTMKDGKTKVYRINSDKAIDSDTIYIRVRDLIEAAGVNPEDVEKFIIRNNTDAVIVWMDLTTGSSEYAEIVPKGISRTASVEAETETNPATGSEGFAALAAVSGVSALAALAFRKRK